MKIREKNHEKINKTNMNKLMKDYKNVKVENQSMSIKIEDKSVRGSKYKIENKPICNIKGKIENEPKCDIKGKIENEPKCNIKGKIENEPIRKRKGKIVWNRWAKDYKEKSFVEKVIGKLEYCISEAYDWIGINKLTQMLNLLIERVWREQPDVTKKQSNTLIHKYDLRLKSKNGKVLHFNNQNLCSYDIANCLPKSWFNGNLIDFFNMFFCSSQFHRNIPKVYSKHLKQDQYFIERTFSTIVLEECKVILWADNLDNQKKKELVYNLFNSKLSYVFRKNLYDITKISYLILPFNHKRNHWKVFIIEGINDAYHEIRKKLKTEEYIDELEKVLIVYALDSVTKRKYDLSSSALILRLFVNFLIFGQLEKDYPDYIQNRFERGHCFIKDENYELEIVEVPQQTNHYDCGPLSLENIEHFILYGPKVIHEPSYFVNSYDPSQMSIKRKALLNLLVSLQKQYKFEVS